MNESSNPNSVTKKDFRNLLGVSDQTITNWVAKGMPVSGKGHHARYDTVACIQWLKAYWINDALRRNQAPSSDDIEDMELRKAAAEAAIKEIKVAKEMGQLVHVDDAKAELRALIEPLRRKLTTIPASWAQYVVGIRDQPTAITILKERTRRLLDDLANPEPEPDAPILDEPIDDDEEADDD